MNLEELAALFQARDSFILTSHETPDGDGLGAMYALCRTLKKLGKRAEAIISEPLPPKYAFLDAQGLFRIVNDVDSLKMDISKSLLVILDTNDTHFAGRITDLLMDRVTGYILIDHHESRGLEASEHFLDPSASSTCEIAYGLINMLDESIDLDTAVALYAGIVYDTGSFGYPKTTANTFFCALNLVRLGVQPYFVHNLLYESSSIASLLLRKLVLSTLELHSKNRIAVQVMQGSHLEESGAIYEDSEDLINVPLRSESVQVSVLFKENQGGVLRCSMRSKGLINVAHIAQGFGGGGHRTAAGFKCALPLEQTRKSVLDKLKDALH